MNERLLYVGRIVVILYESRVRIQMDRLLLIPQYNKTNYDTRRLFGLHRADKTTGTSTILFLFINIRYYVNS